MLRGRLSEDDLQRVVFVARQVWFRRNKYVVGEELISPTKVNQIADEQVELFNSSEQRSTRRGSNVTEPEASRWEKPLPRWVKINWDASIDKQGKRMGVGALVRDHEGKVRGGKCVTKPLIADPAVAEGVGAWYAADLCCQMGFQKVVLEGDSSEIIQAPRKDGQCWRSYGHLINGAKTLLREVPQWEAHRDRRTKNTAAHNMAKMALVIGEDRVFLERKFPRVHP
jgi:ribonuclease HI